MIKILYWHIKNTGCAFFRQLLPYGLMSVLGQAEIRYAGFEALTNCDGGLNYESLNNISQKILDDLDWCDVLVFGREWMPQGFQMLELAKEKGKKVIYDVDDNLLIVPDWNPAGSVFNQKQVKDYILKYLDSVDLIICTHDELADCFGKRNKTKILKNFVYEPFYKSDKSIIKKDVGDIVIGWAGSGTHAKDLAEISGVVERILKEYKNVYFALLGSCPHDIQKIDDKRIFAIRGDGNPLRYFELLKSMNLDIAIAPLTDVAFNKYKSNLKILEYAACGYPSISSNVFEYKKYIKHGKDGLLAGKYIDWYNLLKRLIIDEKLRKSLVEQSQIKMRKYCDIVSNCQDWVNLYCDFIGKPRQKVVNNFSEEEFTERLKNDMYKIAWFGPIADERRTQFLINNIKRGQEIEAINEAFKTKGFSF